MIQARLVATLIFAVSSAVDNAYAYKASVLIDFDPNSAEQTVIVESIAVDHKDMLYACDRVSGNVWRIDPKDPKLVVVGRVPEREIGGKKVRANVSGIVFNAAGDLYLTAGGFSEVLRIRGRNLDPREPGTAQTFATQTEGANGIAFDKSGNLYVTGGRNGASTAPDRKAAMPRFLRRSRCTPGFFPMENPSRHFRPIGLSSINKARHFTSPTPRAVPSGNSPSAPTAKPDSPR